jgi:hypothetical protein
MAFIARVEVRWGIAHAPPDGVPRSAFNEVAMSFIQLIAGLSVVLCVGGCHTGHPVPDLISRHVTPAILVPHDVRRIAVLYPQAASAEWTQAYHRLEGATFGLKTHRPHLTIVDRLHLPVLLGEHRFQLTGAVADNSAVHIGRLLGADSVLIYRIDGPSLRDRMWARQVSDLPPIMVTSKLIRVESSEVLYHRVVVAQLEESAASDWWDSHDAQRLSREALERGIRETVVELGRAFH